MKIYHPMNVESKGNGVVPPLAVFERDGQDLSPVARGYNLAGLANQFSFYLRGKPNETVTGERTPNMAYALDYRHPASTVGVSFEQIKLTDFNRGQQSKFDKLVADAFDDMQVM